ncbi:hypothetical protein [Enterobacter quasiroggenkampii]|uniref:hypothetical protein n=1 Tax=Enterobacter quasiroggenkampii TaxID=2497436 RepID=UPI0021CEB75B|nr:hypothetical protein [Enterobacter quasiroggenkampii]MCU6407906.1 hypothetical protein [Enterobacter quasiroggenkampii]
MQWALIKNGVVENIIEWEWDGSEETDLFKDYVKVDVTSIQCRIGWVWDGSNFSDPNAPQPPTNSELYKAALTSKNSQYKADIDALNSAWGHAGLFDGASEATKKTQLQSKANSIKAQYLADIAQLKITYGV